jgi:hypothetical protein
MTSTRIRRTEQGSTRGLRRALLAGAAILAVGTFGATPLALAAPANTPPVGKNDTYTVLQAHTLTIPAPGVLANDTDAQSDPLTAHLVAGSANGNSLSLAADGSFTYTPKPGFSGQDNFVYQADDGTSRSENTYVIVNVTPASSAIKVTTTAPATALQDTDITLTSIVRNDGPSDATGVAFNFYPGGFSTFVSATIPAGFSCAPPDVSNCTAPTLANGASATFSIVLLVDVNNPGEVDTQATAKPTSYGTGDFTTSSTKVNPPNSDLSLTVAGPAMATAGSSAVYTFTVHNLGPTFTGAYGTILSTGLSPTSVDVPPGWTCFTGSNVSCRTLDHIPAGATLTLAFTVTVPARDTFLVTGTVQTFADPNDANNTARLDVTVSSGPPAPVAVNDAYSTPVGSMLNVTAPGILANDSGATSTQGSGIQAVPSHGLVAVAADGSFTYTPAARFTGTDTFSYCIAPKAPDAPCLSNTATVTLHVTGPTAVDDHFTVPADTNSRIPPPDVLANDLDLTPDIVALLVTQPDHGTIKDLGSNSGFSYGSTGFTGATVATYCLATLTSPDTCLTNTAPITLTVAAPSATTTTAPTTTAPTTTARTTAPSSGPPTTVPHQTPSATVTPATTPSAPTNQPPSPPAVQARAVLARTGTRSLVHTLFGAALLILGLLALDMRRRLLRRN